MFTFSTGEELQRTFGQRGFLWCLAKRVSLLASHGIYGQTFQDRFAFQAVELGLEPVDVAGYRPEELPDKFRFVAKEGGEIV